MVIRKITSDEVKLDLQGDEKVFSFLYKNAEYRYLDGFS